MELNGITGYSAGTAYTAAAEASRTSASDSTASSTQEEEQAAVYEKSTDSRAAGKTAAKNSAVDRNAVISQMKADLQARTNQLLDIVTKMFDKQGRTYALASGSQIFTGDFWEKFKAEGGTVDAAAVQQAKEDISENGYWGVKQTSDRILDFAKALGGNNPENIDKLQSAFEKGYKQAAKAWGSALPQISQDTYKAVMDGFDAWRNEGKAS